MKLLSKEILNFLDEHGGIYLNPKGVEFASFPDGSICFAATWPGSEGNKCYDLSLILETDTVDELVNILNLSTLQQLKSLSPIYLLNLYHQGKVAVNCTIEQEPVYYTLNFFMVETKVWAHDDYGDGYLVFDRLEKPADFYEYLRKHARLNQVFF